MKFDFELQTSRLLRNIIVGLLLLATKEAGAQVLGQDKEGFSSIVIPSTNLNIDGTNNVISISFSQLYKLTDKKENKELGQQKKPKELTSDPEAVKVLSENKCFIFYDTLNNTTELKDCIEKAWQDEENNYKKNNKSLLYGIELKGSSKNGLSLIFDDELLANSATANGIVGFHFKKLKKSRKSLADYIHTKLAIKNFDSDYEKSLSTLELFINNLYQKGLISKIYQRRLLKFKDLPKPKNRVLEINARLEALGNPDTEFDIKPRLDEVEKQLDVLNSLLSTIKSIKNGYSLPSLGNIGNTNELKKILVSKGFTGISALTDKEIAQFGKILKDHIFPNLKELVFYDIQSFKFFLFEKGYPNIDKLTDKELQELRSLFKSFIFYSDKELNISLIEDTRLAKEKLKALIDAKEIVLFELKKYEKDNPSSVRYNEIEIKIDLEKYTEETTWMTAEKELLRTKGILESKKLQLKNISSQEVGTNQTKELVGYFENIKKLLSNYIKNQKELLKIDDSQVHFNIIPPENRTVS
jgi:hypothetical protein